MLAYALESDGLPGTPLLILSGCARPGAATTKHSGVLMIAASSTGFRLALTVAFLAAELFHLGWEHTHGGVLSHHLLANPDLPAVSNWWGALLIPLLSWWLVGAIQRRDALRRERRQGGIPPWGGFLGALVYGAVLSTLFAFGSPVVDFLFLGLLALGVVLCLGRPEFVLGFVLGMTFVVGAVLPTMFAFVIAAYSWLLHALVGVIKRRLRPRDGIA